MSTVGKDEAPWLSYNKSLDEKLSPELEKEIEEYSKHRHEKSSTQNEEELCRQTEINTEISKQYQFLHPDEYRQEQCRIGKILHPSSFIRKLQSLGLNCWYRKHPHVDKITLVIVRNGKIEVGCWIPRGFTIEYSIVRFDRYGVPLDEKFRGWRTCLLQLILKGFITEKEADDLFGKAKGPASTRYLSTLYSVRNRECKVV